MNIISLKKENRIPPMKTQPDTSPTP